MPDCMAKEAGSIKEDSIFVDNSRKNSVQKSESYKLPVDDFKTVSRKVSEMVDQEAKNTPDFTVASPDESAGKP